MLWGLAPTADAEEPVPFGIANLAYPSSLQTLKQPLRNDPALQIVAIQRMPEDASTHRSFDEFMQSIGFAHRARRFHTFRSYSREACAAAFAGAALYAQRRSARERKAYEDAQEAIFFRQSAGPRFDLDDEQRITRRSVLLRTLLGIGAFAASNSAQQALGWKSTAVAPADGLVIYSRLPILSFQHNTDFKENRVSGGALVVTVSFHGRPLRVYSTTLVNNATDANSAELARFIERTSQPNDWAFLTGDFNVEISGGEGEAYEISNKARLDNLKKVGFQYAFGDGADLAQSIGSMKRPGGDGPVRYHDGFFVRENGGLVQVEQRVLYGEAKNPARAMVGHLVTFHLVP